MAQFLLFGQFVMSVGRVQPPQPQEQVLEFRVLQVTGFWLLDGWAGVVLGISDKLYKLTKSDRAVTVNHGFGYFVASNPFTGRGRFSERATAAVMKSWN